MNVTLYKKGDKLFYYALYKFFYRRHRDRVRYRFTYSIMITTSHLLATATTSRANLGRWRRRGRV